MSIFGQSRIRTMVVIVVGVHLFTSLLMAEDTYYEIPVNQLKITEGTLPIHDQQNQWRYWRHARSVLPYAILDGDGEVYLGRDVGGLAQFDRFRRNTVTVRLRNTEQDDGQSPNSLAIRVPEGTTITGSLYVPNSDFTKMLKIKFEVSTKETNNEACRKNFYLAKADHYRRLVDRNIPGGAWFRYQARHARSILTGESEEEPINTTQPRRRNRRGLTQTEETYQIFSGGRAVSENLQLDLLIRATKPDETTVQISTLEGITVQEMDWSELTEGINPETDPLAAYIPADQHALFFPSSSAMVTMMDEATSNGTPVLHLLQPRAEDARSKERYERQLCLSVDLVARLLGDQVINSVAFTGSDPYLRTGTDVAVLFEAKSTIALQTFILAKQNAAVQTYSGCQQVSGSVGGVEYTGAVSPDRIICSYMATIGNTIIVTNSLVQLERLAEVAGGQSASIGSLPEYKFFRHRYQRSDKDETALLIVTDATIRRWCGPQWRISTSRRTRAAAIMAQHQASHLSQLVEGDVEPELIHTKLHVSDLGTLHVTETGIKSSTYGTLEFLTPIAELNVTKVTPAEAASYRRWRDGYQRYWRQFFDPIAVRFSIRDDRLQADLTVMPLIDQSDYNDFIELTSGAAIDPSAGDRHDDSLLHWAMAINVDSQPLLRSANFLQSMVPSLKSNPLGWLGKSVAIYVDEDPFWEELMQAEDPQEYLFKERMYRLPLALHAEVSNSLKLTMFLTGARAFIQQTAPGMTEWEVMDHNDQPYVKISADDPMGSTQKLAIYYSATASALVITLNEDLLKRSLDRLAARKTSKANNDPVNEMGKPLLGSSLALHVDGKSIGVLEKLSGGDYQIAMQRRCWANIPILNEWMHLFPHHDPLELHTTFWQSRLLCPGGGTYVWNETFQTMESTVYGHPGEPKSGPESPAQLKGITSLNFGVTFENDGLRAKVDIERTTGQ